MFFNPSVLPLPIISLLCRFPHIISTCTSLICFPFETRYLSCNILLFFAHSAKAMLCTTSNDCHPSDLILHQVPAVYINCSDNKCVCTGCFYSTNGYKSCGYKRCWQYVAATHTCKDLRKDQRTAFLLSLFLSFAGAANFYIEQYILGYFNLSYICLLTLI